MYILRLFDSYRQPGCIAHSVARCTALAVLLGSASIASFAAVKTPDWLAIRSIDDATLATLIDPKGNDRLSGEETRARALLTQAERNLNRSLADAEANLLRANTMITAGSDEAAFALALQCQIEQRRKDPALLACDQLGILNQQPADLVVRGYVHLTLARHLGQQGLYEQAREHIEHANNLARESGDHLLATLTNNWIAVRHNIERLPKLALAHYETAWMHAEQTPVPELKQLVSFNLGSAYSQLGRHNEAMALFEGSMELPIFNVNPTRKVIYRSVVAFTLIGLNRAAQAERDLLEVLPALEDDIHSDVAAQAYSALGQTQLAQDNVDQALRSFDKARSLLSDPNHPRGRAILVHHAGALRQADQPREALSVLLSVIDQLPADSPNQLLHDALLELSAIRSQLGDTQAAATAAARAATVREQLNNVAVEHQLSRLRTSVELDRRNQELELARERESAAYREAQRASTLRYMTALLTMLLFLIAYLYFSRQMQRRITDAERRANAKLESDVAARTAELETQMAERMRAEVERRHLLAKLAEGEKLRAVGQLTAGVAHDFNNLMTAVTLTTEYLKNNDNDQSEAREALLDDILSATDSAARITGGLLAYARQQPLKPRELQLDEFLEDSELIFRNTLGERHLLRTSFTPCSVKVDQGQLASAMLNLLLNAKEALGERGTVEISLRRISSNPKRSDADTALISVRDSGCGMTDDQLSHATEPFFTTKPGGEGSGLGLSMVYGFALQSGGDLKLHSAPGQGTTVELSLPLAASNAAPSADLAEFSGTSDPLPADLQVLVVEDREPVLSTLALSLRQLGAHPIATANAEEALAYIARQGPPDLLLSDVKMPGELNGPELLDTVRAQYPELPVLLMSGYTQQLDNDYLLLNKPFSTEELALGLHRALDEVRAPLAADSAAQSLTA